MKISVDNEDGLIVVRPDGKLDALTSPALQEALDRAIDDGASRIIIDMVGVKYVSSAGLRVFIRVGKKLMQSGKFAVAGPHPSVRQVFDMAGFDMIMSIFDDVETAKSSV